MDAMRNVASMAKSSDFKRTVRELKVSRAKAHQPRRNARPRLNACNWRGTQNKVYNYSEIEQMVREVTVSRANALPPAALRGRV
jgi:hypothetical protein